MFKQFLPAEDMISKRPVKCPICRKKANSTTTIYTTKQKGVFANTGGESKGAEDTDNTDEELSCCICMEEDLPELEKFPCGHLVCKQCCVRLGFKDNLPKERLVTRGFNMKEWMDGEAAAIQALGAETIEINSNVNSGEYISNMKIKKVIIHEGVDTIGEKAFMDCHNIKEVVFPKSLKYIGAYAFYGGNISKMNLEDTQVTRIRPHTFENGIRFERGTLLLPTTLKYIETSAFETISGVHKVLFPKTLISIGEKAFFDCSLQEVLFESFDIDHTLHIGEMAFQMARIMNPTLASQMQRIMGENSVQTDNEYDVVLPKNTEIYIDRSSIGQGTLGAFEKGTRIKFVDEAEMSQLRRDQRIRDELQRELRHESDEYLTRDDKDYRDKKLALAARDKEVELAALKRFELAARRSRTKK